MSNKNSWLSNNWFNVALSIFLMGGVWITLQYKIEGPEAREISKEVFNDLGFSKVDGEILKNDLSHIKSQLKRIENQTNDIKKLIELIHPPN